MSYKIEIDRKALKFIDKQPQEQKRRILSAIGKLPSAGDIQPLKGAPGLFRLLVGGYRIIFHVDHGVLTVYVIVRTIAGTYTSGTDI